MDSYFFGYEFLVSFNKMRESLVLRIMKDITINVSAVLYENDLYLDRQLLMLNITEIQKFTIF